MNLGPFAVPVGRPMPVPLVNPDGERLRGPRLAGLQKGVGPHVERERAGRTVRPRFEIHLLKRGILAAQIEAAPGRIVQVHPRHGGPPDVGQDIDRDGTLFVGPAEGVAHRVGNQFPLGIGPRQHVAFVAGADAEPVEYGERNAVDACILLRRVPAAVIHMNLPVGERRILEDADGVRHLNAARQPVMARHTLHVRRIAALDADDVRRIGPKMRQVAGCDRILVGIVKRKAAGLLLERITDGDGLVGGIGVDDKGRADIRPGLDVVRAGLPVQHPRDAAGERVNGQAKVGIFQYDRVGHGGSS